MSNIKTFNLEDLLAPVSADRPCGEDLAYSSEFDAIEAARLADDPTLDQGEWKTALRSADWPFVAATCTKLITSRSKDLKLAVWLTEASAKTGGLRAMGDALLLVAALCERYWDGLYPLPDEGSFEQRAGYLGLLEVRVRQLAREVKLTEGRATAFSLVEVAGARLRGLDAIKDVESAKLGTSRGFFRALLDDSAHCLAAIAQLRRVTDECLGEDGPGFKDAREALDDVIRFARPGARDPAAREVNNAADGDEPGVDTGTGTVAAAAPRELQPNPQPHPQPHLAAGGAPQTRAQALAQLRAVAEYFRHTEPHSPVAYLAERAAQWGEQSLHVWLRGVVKDPAVCAQLEEMLGVPPAG
jgi:type VI secretion system protein ImpA